MAFVLEEQGFSLVLETGFFPELKVLSGRLS